MAGIAAGGGAGPPPVHPDVPEPRARDVTSPFRVRGAASQHMAALACPGGPTPGMRLGRQRRTLFPHGVPGLLEQGPSASCAAVGVALREAERFVPRTEHRCGMF